MTITAHRSPVATFLAGEVPLARMFWLYGVAGAFAAGVVVGGLGGVNRGLQQIAALLLLAYLLAWYVGLWRSAERYAGLALWKWAARAVVTMPIVGFLLTLALSAVPRQGTQFAPKTATPVQADKPAAPADFQFDPSTARPVEDPTQFDPRTPRPVDEPKYLSDQDVGFPAKSAPQTTDKFGGVLVETPQRP